MRSRMCNRMSKKVMVGGINAVPRGWIGRSSAAGRPVTAQNGHAGQEVARFPGLPRGSGTLLANPCWGQRRMEFGKGRAMESLCRSGRARLWIGASAILILGSGCATRGFVRGEVETLRHAMAERTEQLAAEVDRVRNSAEDASRRADLALGAAEESRSLALGEIGYREVSRHSVAFAFDSSELGASEQAALEEAAAAILARPDVIVDIYGFTDPSGPADYNRRLAGRRAEAVLHYLAERTPGPYGRFAAVSFGESRPLAGTAGETAAQQRKAVVSLYEKVPRMEADRGGESPPGAAVEWN